jgi:hypothetical protein
MHRPPTTNGQDERFGAWLRREAFRALKLGAVLLVASLALVYALDATWPGFGVRWQRVNYMLSRTALEQHPQALVGTFATRLGGSEYGWGLLSWAEPFNVTAAADELRRDYPEIIEVRDGKAIVRQTSVMRRQGSQQPEIQARRSAAYLARYHEIEAHRFTRLYQHDIFSPPDANAELGQIGTKILGLPDAALHTVRHIVLGGITSVLLSSTMLALAAVALFKARRPSRFWLKLLVWPLLASALIWAGLIAMSLGVLFGGAFTPNTSVVSFCAALPLLFVCAEAPMRLADALLFKPKPWDGVERRKNRAPTPPAA